jgi:hypothetical protein
MPFVNPSEWIAVPGDIAVCPICNAPIVVEANVWESGTGRIVEFGIECTTEPDIDSDEWPDWHAWHYRMPYVDWPPLERPIRRWLDRTYRIASPPVAT